MMQEKGKRGTVKKELFLLTKDIKIKIFPVLELSISFTGMKLDFFKKKQRHGEVKQ